MLKERSFLITELEFFIKSNIIEQDLIKEVLSDSIKKDSLCKHLSYELIDNVMKLNTPLKMLSDAQLMHLTNYLNDRYKFKENIKDWYTPDEISNYLSDTKIKSTDKMLVLEDVIYNGDDNNKEYKCYVSLDQIVDICKNGFIGYDVKAQRVGIIKKRGVTSTIMPDIKDESVDAIANLVAKGKYKSNDLIINILKTDVNVGFFYESTSRRLTINLNEAKLHLTDGAHRFWGIVKGKTINPNATGMVAITFINVTTVSATEIVYQIAMSNAHNRELIEKYNTGNMITDFITNLNAYGSERNNYFYEKIDIYSSNEHNGTYIKFETLYEAFKQLKIDNFLNTAKLKEIDRFKKFMISYFTLFAESYKENNDESIILEDSTFICGMLSPMMIMFSKSEDIDVDIIEKLARNKLDMNIYTCNLPFTHQTRKALMTAYNNLYKKVVG